MEIQPSFEPVPSPNSYPYDRPKHCEDFYVDWKKSDRFLVTFLKGKRFDFEISGLQPFEENVFVFSCDDIWFLKLCEESFNLKKNVFAESFSKLDQLLMFSENALFEFKSFQEMCASDCSLDELWFRKLRELLRTSRILMFENAEKVSNWTQINLFACFDTSLILCSPKRGFCANVSSHAVMVYENALDDDPNNLSLVTYVLASEKFLIYFFCTIHAICLAFVQGQDKQVKDSSGAWIIPSLDEQPVSLETQPDHESLSYDVSKHCKMNGLVKTKLIGVFELEKCFGLKVSKEFCVSEFSKIVFNLISIFETFSFDRFFIPNDFLIYVFLDLKFFLTDFVRKKKFDSLHLKTFVPDSLKLFLENVFSVLKSFHKLFESHLNDLVLKSFSEFALISSCCVDKALFILRSVSEFWCSNHLLDYVHVLVTLRNHLGLVLDVLKKKHLLKKLFDYVFCTFDMGFLVVVQVQEKQVHVAKEIDHGPKEQLIQKRFQRTESKGRQQLTFQFGVKSWKLMRKPSSILQGSFFLKLLFAIALMILCLIILFVSDFFPFRVPDLRSNLFQEGGNDTPRYSALRKHDARMGLNLVEANPSGQLEVRDHFHHAKGSDELIARDRYPMQRARFGVTRDIIKSHRTGGSKTSAGMEHLLELRSDVNFHRAKSVLHRPVWRDKDLSRFRIYFARRNLEEHHDPDSPRAVQRSDRAKTRCFGFYFSLHGHNSFSSGQFFSISLIEYIMKIAHGTFPFDRAKILVHHGAFHL